MIPILLSTFLFQGTLAQQDSCRAPDAPWDTRKVIWSVRHHPDGPNPYMAAASRTHLFIVAENPLVPARIAGARGGEFIGLRIPLTGNAPPHVIVAPPHRGSITYPKIAVDDSGVLHMVWTESTMVKGLPSGEVDYRTNVFTASYRADRWAQIQLLTSYGGFLQTRGSGSELIRTSGGDLHMIIPGNYSEPDPFIMHISRVAGMWKVSRLTLDSRVGYAGIATRNDSLFIGLAKPVRDRIPDAASVWFGLSPDGEHWNPLTLVSRSYELTAREIRVVAKPASPIVLMWSRKAEPDGFFSGALWAAWSADAGKTWDPPFRITSRSGIAILGAVTGEGESAGALLWVNDNVAAARVCRNSWSAVLPVPGSLNSTGSAAILHTGDDRPQVLWSAVIRAANGEIRRMWYQSTLR